MNLRIMKIFNLYYNFTLLLGISIWHLNESEDDVNEEKDLENDISVETRDVNTSSLDNRLNVKDNAAKMLNNRLQGNFVSKNVVNLSRRTLRVLK